MKTTKLARYLSYVVAVILILVPFQAVLTTWAGSNFGHIDLFRIWKELLMIPLVLAVLYLAYKDKKTKQWLTSSPLVLLIILYVLIQLGLGIYALRTDRVNNSALIYALLINLRYLLFFLVCIIVAAQSDWLSKNWQKFIIWPAIAVIVFGLLQHFVLPNNFLTHFGYGPKTIPAYQTVDQKPQYIRLQSTLRGPNPLGAYLVVIFGAMTLVWLRAKRRLALSLLMILSLIVLYFTYSRSAWAGTVLSCLLLIWWMVKSRKTRQWLLLGSILTIILLLGAVLAWHRNSVLENTLFHTSQTSQSSESSNAVRSEAMLDGAKSVLRQPLGAGPGTAGPASFRNNHPPRIAENYYIQIGQEVGVLGLIFFVAINLYVAKLLWDDRANDLSKLALALLIGLSLVNFLSHAWADDTLAYVYWGLAGISLAKIVKKPNKSPTKT